jgi:RNA polymerase sigma factor (TIGR02999 family)
VSSALSSPFGERGNGARESSNALLDMTGGAGGPSKDALFAALYRELHALARQELARRIAPANLGVTTLVHEAYLNLVGRTGPSFPDPARFMGYVARVMRGLIIDRARSCTALKRGGEFEVASVALELLEGPIHAQAFSQVSEALDQLAIAEPELAEVVDLKFFCGCTFAEIAALKKLSERTIQRRWEKARIYLSCSLGQGPDGLENPCLP